jgi:CRISPR/Cas system-associated exonuclease Cas4 (RecB family)
MAEFSFTRLSEFETCPYMYYLRYVCGIEEPPTEALQLGKAVHGAISRLLQGEHDINYVVEEEVKKQELLTLDKHFSEVYGMVDNFAACFAVPPGSRLFSELFLEKPLGDHKLIGYADLVQEMPGEVIITDFKTGWKQYEAEDTQQLALYAWMVRDKFPGKPVKARLWWLRYKRGPQVEVEVDADGAAAWAEKLIAQVEEAAAWPGDMGYSRNVGTACASCAFSGRCLGIHVPEDPSELAGLALRLEACLERVKALLKERVSAAGPVEIGGEVWDLYPRVSWKFDDVQAVYNFLAGCVRDPWKYLKVDTQKIAPLLKGELGEDLRALGEQFTTVYLGHKPLGADCRDQDRTI